eukprot:1898610-Prorocentrum_lima.AAC.1
MKCVSRGWCIHVPAEVPNVFSSESASGFLATDTAFADDTCVFAHCEELAPRALDDNLTDLVAL